MAHAREPAEPEREDGGARAWAVSAGTLVVGSVTVAVLVRYNLAHRVDEAYLIVNLTGLLFVPLLLILWAARESPARFGFRLPEAGSARIAWALFGIMVPVLAVASRFPDFRAYYPMRPEAAYSWGFLAYHELTYGFYLFGWEFFYRGFLTFGLARRFGGLAAVVLQAVGFGIMHYTKPWPEFCGAFAAGMALGWLALRARSFLPCFAIHWPVSILFDLLAIHGKPGAIF